MAKTTESRNAKQASKQELDFASVTKEKRDELKRAGVDDKDLERFKRRYGELLKNPYEFCRAVTLYNSLDDGLKNALCQITHVSNSTVRGYSSLPRIPRVHFKRWQRDGLKMTHFKWLGIALQKNDEWLVSTRKKHSEQQATEREAEILRLGDCAAEEEWTAAELKRELGLTTDKPERAELGTKFAALAKELANLSENSDRKRLLEVFKAYNRGKNLKQDRELSDDDCTRLISVIKEIATS